MKKVPDPEGKKSTDPTGSGSSSLIKIIMHAECSLSNVKREPIFCAGRVFWGYLHDVFGYKMCMMLVTVCISVLYSTLYFTEYGSKVCVNTVYKGEKTRTWIKKEIFSYKLSLGGVRAADLANFFRVLRELCAVATAVCFDT